MPSPLQEIHFLLTTIPEAVALTIGLIRYKRLEYPLHYLVVLVSVSLVTAIIMGMLAHDKINNHFIIALYIPVEFWLICLIYKKQLRNQAIQAVIPWVAGSLTAYSLWGGVFREQTSFSPTARFLEGLFVLSLVLCYFYQTLKHLTSRHLESTPLFWFSAGLFIYFACDMLIFIFSNFILHDYSKQFNYQLWSIHAVLNAILYFFYALTLWIDPKN